GRSSRRARPAAASREGSRRRSSPWAALLPGLSNRGAPEDTTGAAEPPRAGITDDDYGLRTCLDEAVSVREGIVLQGHSLDRFDCFSKRHAVAMALRPTQHAREGLVLLSTLPRSAERTLIARQNDVTVLGGEAEDLLVVGALPEVLLQVHHAHHG